MKSFLFFYQFVILLLQLHFVSCKFSCTQSGRRGGVTPWTIIDIIFFFPFCSRSASSLPESVILQDTESMQIVMKDSRNLHLAEFSNNSAEKILVEIFYLCISKKVRTIHQVVGFVCRPKNSIGLVYLHNYSIGLVYLQKYFIVMYMSRIISGSTPQSELFF